MSSTKYDSRLYPQQLSAIIGIEEHFKNNNNKPYLFVAAPSFGKTFIGIEFTRLHGNAECCSLIITPTNTFCVWKMEYAKLHASYNSKSIADKKLLNIKNHSKFINSAAVLSDRIIITSTIPIISTKIASIVIDECQHIHDSIIEKALSFNVPTLLLSATPVKPGSNILLGITTSAPKVELKLPTIIDEIVNNKDMKTIKEYISKNSKDNICLALASETDVKVWSQDIKATFSNIHIHIYTTSAQRGIKIFDEKGGILVTTVRMIANGKNLNNCRHMIAVCNDARNCMTVDDLYQVRCRIARTSSIYDKVYVYLLCSSDQALIRAYMAKFNFNGWSSIARANTSNILSALGEKINTLNAADLLILFGEKIQQGDTSHDIKDKTPTLTMQEIITLICS